MNIIVIMELQRPATPVAAQVADLFAPGMTVPNHDPQLPTPQPYVPPGNVRRNFKSYFSWVSSRAIASVDSILEEGLHSQQSQELPSTAAVQQQTPESRVDNEPGGFTHSNGSTNHVRSLGLPQWLSSGGNQSKLRNPTLKLLFKKHFKFSRSQYPSILIPAQDVNGHPLESRPSQTVDVCASEENGHIEPPITCTGAITAPEEATVQDTHALSTITNNEPIASTHVEVRATQQEANKKIRAVNSPELYSPEMGVYVGHPEKLRPPEPLRSRCHQMIRTRLIFELGAVLEALPLSKAESTVYPELCWSGGKIVGNSSVELIPTLWIRCGSKECQKAVASAAQDLSYLRRYTIRVTTHSPRPASSGARQNRLSDHIVDATGDEILPIDSPETLTWWRSFRVEVQAFHLNDFSACGLKMRFINSTGEKYNCTLGGLVQVNGEIFGLTTAHAMCDAYSETHDADSSGSLRYELRSNASWLPATLISARHGRKDDFQTLQMAQKRSSGNISNSDFALVRLDLQLPRTINRYRVPPVRDVTVQSISEDLEPKSVKLLCSSSDIRAGVLLQDEAFILDKWGCWETRRIRLEKPLGKACKVNVSLIRLND